MIRIVSGKYKGKRLAAPEGDRTRPTTEKVRESAFNILASNGEIRGRVLDLFAGSGALGIEALSRGAEEAVFVEKNPKAAAVVRRNVSEVGCGSRVFNTDWKVAVRKLVGQAPFDLILLDPPYALGIESDILRAVTEGGLLAPGGVIVVEHAADNDFAYDDKIFSADRRTYSDTCVTFLRRRADEEA